MPYMMPFTSPHLHTLPIIAPPHFTHHHSSTLTKIPPHPKDFVTMLSAPLQTFLLTLALSRLAECSPNNLPKRDHLYGGNRKAATAGITLSVIALVLSIVAFFLMLYNRRMRAQNPEIYRAYELESRTTGDSKRDYPTARASELNTSSSNQTAAS
jgi:hypothetical protein